MNMMISYQELVRTFLRSKVVLLKEVLEGPLICWEQTSHNILNNKIKTEKPYQKKQYMETTQIL